MYPNKHTEQAPNAVFRLRRPVFLLCLDLKAYTAEPHDSEVSYMILHLTDRTKTHCNMHLKGLKIVLRGGLHADRALDLALSRRPLSAANTAYALSAMTVAVMKEPKATLDATPS